MERIGVEPGTDVGGYRVLAPLGRGGMGAVYRAVDGDGVVVAVKLLHPHLAAEAEGRERLRREVAHLQRVRHPAVARVLDAEIESTEAFVVTELVDGADLAVHVREHGPLDPTELLRLAERLHEALEVVHTAGVLHRDLSPGNVLMSSRGPVLIDFGIAQAVDDTRVTSTGLVVGTPGYLSPELLAGGEPTQGADLWGWAAVVTFAATGRAPFGTRPLEAVLARVRSGEADLAGLDPRTAAALRSALAVDPSRRATPEEVLHELRLAAAGDVEPDRSRTVVLPAGGQATAVLPWDGRGQPDRGAPGTGEDGTHGTQVLPADGTQVLPADGTRVLPADGTQVPPAGAPGRWDDADDGWDDRDDRDDADDGWDDRDDRDDADDGWDEEDEDWQDAPALEPGPYDAGYGGVYDEDPRIGEADAPGVPPQPPHRPVSVLALAVAAVAVGASRPVAAVLGVVALAAVARTVGTAVDAVRARRARRGGPGRRGGDALRTALASPWYLLRGVLGVVPAALVAVSAGLVAGGVAWWLVGSGQVVLAAPGDGRTGELPGNAWWVPHALLAATVLLVLLVLWFGPSMRTTRWGARWVLSTVAPGRAGAVVVVVVALSAAWVVAASLGGVSWWPFGGAPPVG